MSEQTVSAYRREGYLHLRSFFIAPRSMHVRRDAFRVFRHQIKADERDY